MIGEIIDALTGPSPREHLSIQNAEYDGETIEELLPPASKGGVHMRYVPPRKHMREIAEHHGPERLFGMQYSINRCGAWQYVKEENGEIVEQCDTCGEYRRREGFDE